MNTNIESFPAVNDQAVEGTTQNVDSVEAQHRIARSQGRVPRRFFMKSLALGGASLLPTGLARADEGDNQQGTGSITNGDAAILRFLAAAEILETDLWQQYTEFRRCRMGRIRTHSRILTIT